MILAVALLLWQTVVANDSFERGMELAGEQRWAEARAAFEAGWRAAPKDKRFAVELAGIAFKQKQLGASRRYLRSALRLDPDDSYAEDFLATIYLLDGNQEAALKYWNRAGKPRVQEIRMEPEPAIDPVLLDRAFAFSPAAVLKLDEYRLTCERMAMLGVFPVRKIELLPRADEDFDVVFRSAERRPWWVSLVRGLPFQAVNPEFYNLGRSGTNFVSLARWDAQKRRVFAELSGPIAREAGKRYRVFLDGRNENWNVAGLGGFNLEKVEGGVGVESIVNSRWSWGADLAMGTRRFRNSSLPGGASIYSEGRARYKVVNAPERRFTVDSEAAMRLGRTFAESLGLYSQGQGTLEARWFPQARGEDYGTVARVRAGRTFGRAPFDNLFLLGLERDNDLLLRAHIGTEHGQKGSAPMARSYVLSNWEMDKIVYSAGLASFSAGPFVDSGRAYGIAGTTPGKWLWDVGAQAKVRVPGGFTAVFSYGKDLRTGRGAFYARVEK
jgi:hypothetical protein